MTPAAFITAGRVMFGGCWHGELADALQVSSRTVSRWASGQRQIPDNIPGELRYIAGERITEIKRLLEKI